MLRIKVLEEAIASWVGFCIGINEFTELCFLLYILKIEGWPASQPVAICFELCEKRQAKIAIVAFQIMGPIAKSQILKFGNTFSPVICRRGASHAR